MSVSADIITEAKPDVLLVPNSAIKTQGETYYVEVLKNPTTPKGVTPTASSGGSEGGSSGGSSGGSEGVLSETPPVEQIVEIGSANDTMTEILSGLNEGDQVVTRTITNTSTTSTTNNQSSSQSILQATGSRNSGGFQAGGGAMFRD